MVAPASANVIGKMANGIADDMLTTTILAAKCPKLVSPAMNTNMYENRIVQDNIKKLEHYGFEMIKPAEGYLACGDTGAGKMPEPQTLFNYIMRTIACEKGPGGTKTYSSQPERRRWAGFRFSLTCRSHAARSRLYCSTTASALR